MNGLALSLSLFLFAEAPVKLPKYGTQVEWEPSREAAAEKARREGKLMLVLHVAGDFPVPGRT